MIFGSICIAVGLCLFFLAFHRRSQRCALLRNSVRVTGVVVRLEETTTEGDLVTTHSPVVKYEAKDGQVHEIKLLPRQDTKSSRVGAKIPIFYEAGNPENAVEVMRMWDVNLGCVLSLILVLIGVGAIYTVYQGG